jgi:hypothetical protein
MDLQGRAREKFNILAGQQISIGQALPAGIYFVEVMQGEKIATKKLVKW